MKTKSKSPTAEKKMNNNSKKVQKKGRHVEIASGMMEISPYFN
jgi:hypothetical protein